MYRMNISHWSVERAVFAFGGSLMILFSLLALAVHPDFSYGTLFVGGMFVFFALTGYCPAATVFARLLSKKS
jgi:hypothetical protein